MTRRDARRLAQLALGLALLALSFPAQAAFPLSSRLGNALRFASGKSLNRDLWGELWIYHRVELPGGGPSNRIGLAFLYSGGPNGRDDTGPLLRRREREPNPPYAAMADGQIVGGDDLMMAAGVPTFRPRGPWTKGLPKHGLVPDLVVPVRALLWASIGSPLVLVGLLLAVVARHAGRPRSCAWIVVGLAATACATWASVGVVEAIGLWKIPMPPWLLIPSRPTLITTLVGGWLTLFAFCGRDNPPSRVDGTLRPVTQTVWEHLAPIRYQGFRLARRMTVVRLRDGGLWLHSPNALDHRLRADLEALGPVRYLVAPSLSHHADLEAYQQAFPVAQLCAPPGLARKRPDLRVDVTLDPAALPWGDELEARVVAGVPELAEHVFFHPESRTLIVADLLFRFGREDALETRLLALLDGTDERVALSRHMRWRHVRDAGAFQASLAPIAEWPAERLLMAHAQQVVALEPGALRESLGVAPG